MRHGCFLATLALAFATLTGCYGPDGGFMPGSGRGYTYQSTSMSPLTISVTDTRTEEAFFVLEGTGQALAVTGKSPIKPRMALIAPIGQQHGFLNDSDQPLRIVCSFPVAKR